MRLFWRTISATKLGAMEVDVKTWQLDTFLVNNVVVLLIIHLGGVVFPPYN